MESRTVAEMGSSLLMNPIKQIVKMFACKNCIDYRSVFDNIHDAVFIHDSQTGSIIDVNECMLKMYGYARKEALSKTVEELSEGTPPYSRLEAESYMQKSRSGLPQIFEWHARHRDGTLFWVECSMKTMQSKSHLTVVSVRKIEPRKSVLQERNCLFNLSLDMMCIADFNGHFKQVNPAFTRILGWSEEELLSNPWLTFVYEEDRGATVKAGEKLLAGEKVIGFRNRYKCKNGDVKWISWNSRSFPEEKLIYAVIRDVTKFIEAEQALRESEERFRNIIQSSPMGIYLYELEDTNRLVMIDANPAADKFTGVCNTKLIGKTIEEAFPGLIDTDVPMRYREAAAEGKEWSTTKFVYEDKDIQGAYNVYAFQTSPGRMAVFFLDITKQMQAEKTLRESTENLQTTLNSIGDAVITTEASGRVSGMNPVAEKLTGWPIGESKGKKLEDIFHIEHESTRGEIKETVQKAMGAGNALTLADSTILVNRLGKRIQIADSRAPIKNASGETIGLVLVFRDVSEEKELQAQLRQSQKMDSIGQLAGGVAHDFNNILAGIIGSAEILQDKLPPSVLKDSGRFIDMILSMSGRAADLTRKLLTFSRKSKLEIADLDPGTTVEQVIDILSHTIDPKISLSRTCKHVGTLISGDASQVQNAILNLAINARDAMPNGGSLSITVDCYKCFKKRITLPPFELSPGNYVRIKVQDTGCGIPKENLDRIFEPFFTTKTAGRGTGLGLAAVYGTMQDHKGAVDIKSTPGIGTCFALYFPASEKAEEVSAVKKTTNTKLKGQGTILVVDDEEIIRTLLCEILHDLGFETLSAQNGREAVELYAESHVIIRAVILDIVMPVMDGSETFSKIREINPEARIILSSGFMKSGSVEELAKQGAVSFLQKPYQQNSLRKVLLEALK